MKAIFLYGSPRKDGDSATIAKHFLKGLNENNNFEIQHFYTNELDIVHCQGCESCLKTNKCIIDDDMQAIYPAFKEADIVVWVSSMFWGYLTSQLKTALDRMEAIVNYFDNKTFVVILTYRRHYETAASFFKRIAPFHNIDLHFITYGSHDFEKNIHIHASKAPEKLKEAFELGQKLNKLSKS